MFVPGVNVLLLSHGDSIALLIQYDRRGGVRTRS